MNYIEKKYNELSICKYHIISILALVMFGIYKNGLSLYFFNEVSFIEGLMPLVYVMLFVAVIVLIKTIMKKKISINDFYYFSTVLFLPITYNYMLVIVLFSICYFLSLTKIKIPFNLLFIIFLYLLLGDNLIFNNSVELSKNFNYSSLDLFLGKGESYLMTSNVLLCILTYIYLSFMPYYKSLIPIVFMIFYTLLVITVGYFINFDFTNIFGIFTVVIILGSSFTYTPNKNLKMCLYSLLIAITTIIFNIMFNYYIGIFISIFIIQILSIYSTQKSFT